MRDNNPDMNDATAQRIVTEALKFVAAAAQFPTVKITPSNVVDEGWHALILHTYCTRSCVNGWGGSWITGRSDPTRSATTRTR